MSYIKLKDITLYYETHGSGEPIVFIPGFSSDRTIWGAIIEHFEEDYQLILPDNRGAGMSDVPLGPYSIEQLADDLVALCAGLGIKKAHFVGNSMGGCILQTLAYRQPKLVKSAVIGNSAPNIKTCFHIYLAAQLELLKASAPIDAVIKASCAWVFSYHFLSQPGNLDALIQLALNNPNPFTLTGYEGQYAALEQFDSTAWLDKLSVPTLVLAADQDLIFSKTTGEYLAKHIPDARWHCFSECGHLPQLEYPDAYSDVVKAFIKGVS